VILNIRLCQVDTVDFAALHKVAIIADCFIKEEKAYVLRIVTKVDSTTELNQSKRK